MRARTAAAFTALCGAAFCAPASAGDGKPDAPANVEAEKGPFVAWARAYGDAAQEASERNLCMMLHSHGST
jgi:hypothetical protein